MKKVALVTGGAGFIGGHLAAALLAEGYEVRVVDSLVAGKRERVPAAAAFFELDIRNRESLAEAFAGATHVFHLAALPRVEYSIEHPEETHEVNVTGTLNVLSAARAAGAKRLVFASSAAVYGDLDQMPLGEGLPPKPLSPYALHKWAGEAYAALYARLYGLETVCPRFFNVYGPGLDPEGPYALVIGRFLKLRGEGKPLTITGDGTQTRDFVQVSDIVRGLIRAAEAEAVGKGEAINLGTGRGTSVNELAECFGGERVHVAARIEPKASFADIARAKELLGWEPRIALADGIAELLR